jgi:hypothetical protein
MAGAFFHWAWSCNHVWHPSSQCRQRGVDVCALWESPKISIPESGAYIPTRLLSFLVHINTVTVLLTCTRESYVLSSARPVAIVASVCIVSDACISNSR